MPLLSYTDDLSLVESLQPIKKYFKLNRKKLQNINTSSGSHAKSCNNTEKLLEVLRSGNTGTDELVTKRQHRNTRLGTEIQQPKHRVSVFKGVESWRVCCSFSVHTLCLRRCRFLNRLSLSPSFSVEYAHFTPNATQSRKIY